MERLQVVSYGFPNGPHWFPIASIGFRWHLDALGMAQVSCRGVAKTIRGSGPQQVVLSRTMHDFWWFINRLWEYYGNIMGVCPMMPYLIGTSTVWTSQLPPFGFATLSIWPKWLDTYPTASASSLRVTALVCATRLSLRCGSDILRPHEHAHVEGTDFSAKLEPGCGMWGDLRAGRFRGRRTLQCYSKLSPNTPRRARLCNDARPWASQTSDWNPEIAWDWHAHDDISIHACVFVNMCHVGRSTEDIWWRSLQSSHGKLLLAKFRWQGSLILCMSWDPTH